MLPLLIYIFAVAAPAYWTYRLRRRGASPTLAFTRPVVTVLAAILLLALFEYSPLSKNGPLQGLVAAGLLAFGVLIGISVVGICGIMALRIASASPAPDSLANADGLNFALGAFCHLMVLGILFAVRVSVREVWRGTLVIPGFGAVQHFGTANLYVHDALMGGLMLLTSIVISLGVLLVVRRALPKAFKWGYVAPAIIELFFLLI